MSYTAITTAMVTEFKATVQSFWQRVKDNFDDHQSRINTLEASGVEVPSGTILQYGTATPPAGYLLCDGTAVSRSTYAALFSAIGTTYGVGDGSTTFNVPDLRGRSPVGYHSGDSDFDVGDSGGAETHALSTSEIPAHSHSVTDPGHSHTWPNTEQQDPVFDNTTHAVNDTGTVGSVRNTSTNTTGISVDNTGSGSAHNNVHPFLVCGFVIKT